MSWDALRQSRFQTSSNRGDRVSVEKLRVAYAGHDFFSPCLKAVSEYDGAEIVLCLTNNEASYNQYVGQFARSTCTPIIEGRLDSASIADFNSRRIDLLISAAYFYKFPVSDLQFRYAINVHPSLLPDGRGPNPLPYYADEHPEHCGISIHEITAEMDRGPLLIQEKIEVGNEDNVQDIYLKIVALAPRLLLNVIKNIEILFLLRQSQAGGSYWREHTTSERTIISSEIYARDVIRMHQKFGIFGLIFQLRNGSALQTRQVSAAECPHQFLPGTVIGGIGGDQIIALRDGLAIVSPF
jgi:methionyl-tRNA formyltransferase